MRMNEQRTVGDRLGYFEALRMTAADGSIPKDSPILTWDLRLGNVCNLRCIMCGPYDSSAWYGDYEAVFSDHFEVQGQLVSVSKKPKEGMISPNVLYNWHEDSEFWSNLAEYAPKSINWQFAGGEPLLAERHYLLLEKCIEKGVAPEIDLSYATNLTKLPDKAVEIWSHFKSVHLTCSIDGVGPVIEYIRYGTRWKVIEEHVAKLQEITAPSGDDGAASNIKVSFNPTVGALNVYYIPELIEWYLSLERPDWSIGGHLLTWPTWLSAQILPTAVKEVITQKYKDFFERCEKDGGVAPDWEGRISWILDPLRGYVDFMNKVDTSEELPYFFATLKKLDDRRGLSGDEALSELFDLLEEYRGE
jgi:hypothetical protein